MNAHQIVKQEIISELLRHGLWAAGRQCACGGWKFQARSGKVGYTVLVAAHADHVARVITSRLLERSGLPAYKFLARTGPEATGDGTTAENMMTPRAVEQARQAGERGDERCQTS